MDWNAIRAEYIGGGISQRKLADKYGVSKNTLIKRANTEKWKTQQNEVYNKVTTRIQQETANVAADNSVIAQRIRTKLLKRLEQEIDALPDSIGTEMYQDVTTISYQAGKEGSGTATKRTDGGKKFRLRDLTGAYRDLTEDLNMNANNEPVRIIIDV